MTITDMIYMLEVARDNITTTIQQLKKKREEENKK